MDMLMVWVMDDLLDTITGVVGSVLFALIVLPLILVLSYYIRLQVETINLQNQYYL